ncbi:MAG: hypothetical protein HQM08_26130 [Candidatus Riflebacteria bacterium]|nr:hypothetical protein [Candidatus Riflebacteria bacterium]
MLKRVIFLAVSFLFVINMSFAGDLLSLTPDDAAFVVNVNLEKMLSSEVIKKQIDDNMAKQTPEQKKSFDEFVAKTGIDPFKHIKGLLIFIGNKVDEKTQKPNAAVLIDGTFDSEKIIKAIKEDPKASEDAVIEKFEGLDCIKGKKNADGVGVFLDPNSAVIGNPDSIKTVIGVKKGTGKNIKTNANLDALLKKADTSAAIWGAGLLPAQLKEQAKNNPQMQPLAAINALFFAFNYDKDLNFDFTGELDKKESLEGVMTSLNGFLAMIKMMAGQSPEAAQILNLIKVEGADTTAKITLKVPQATLDELKKKIEEKIKVNAPAPTPAPTPAPAPEGDKK